MFVLYLFCALMGAAFAALSWLRVGPASAPSSPQGDPGEDNGKGKAAVAGCRRVWALPLCVFGLLGLTLHLLDRSPEHTLLWSVIFGPPVGLLAGWVILRINRD